MRTRKKKLSDYGVFPEDEKKILTMCRMADKQERQELMQICIASAPCGIEVYLYWSMSVMVENLNSQTITPAIGKNPRQLYEHQEEALKKLDEINKKEYIAATRDDFYGYRRKAMAKFYDWLRLTRRI